MSKKGSRGLKGKLSSGSETDSRFPGTSFTIGDAKRVGVGRGRRLGEGDAGSVLGPRQVHHHGKVGSSACEGKGTSFFCKILRMVGNSVDRKLVGQAGNRRNFNAAEIVTTFKTAGNFIETFKKKLDAVIKKVAEGKVDKTTTLKQAIATADKLKAFKTKMLDHAKRLGRDWDTLVKISKKQINNLDVVDGETRHGLSKAEVEDILKGEDVPAGASLEEVVQANIKAEESAESESSSRFQEIRQQQQALVDESKRSRGLGGSISDGLEWLHRAVGYAGDAGTFIAGLASLVTSEGSSFAVSVPMMIGAAKDAANRYLDGEGNLPDLLAGVFSERFKDQLPEAQQKEAQRLEKLFKQHLDSSAEHSKRIEQLKGYLDRIKENARGNVKDAQTELNNNVFSKTNTDKVENMPPTSELGDDHTALRNRLKDAHSGMRLSPGDRKRNRLTPSPGDRKRNRLRPSPGTIFRERVDQFLDDDAKERMDDAKERISGNTSPDQNMIGNPTGEHVDNRKQGNNGNAVLPSNAPIGQGEIGAFGEDVKAGPGEIGADPTDPRLHPIKTEGKFLNELDEKIKQIQQGVTDMVADSIDSTDDDLKYIFEESTSTDGTESTSDFVPTGDEKKSPDVPTAANGVDRLDHKNDPDHNDDVNPNRPFNTIKVSAERKHDRKSRRRGRGGGSGTGSGNGQLRRGGTNVSGGGGGDDPDEPPNGPGGDDDFDEDGNRIPDPNRGAGRDAEGVDAPVADPDPVRTVVQRATAPMVNDGQQLDELNFRQYLPIAGADFLTRPIGAVQSHKENFLLFDFQQRNAEFDIEHNALDNPLYHGRLRDDAIRYMEPMQVVPLKYKGDQMGFTDADVLNTVAGTDQPTPSNGLISQYDRNRHDMESILDMQQNAKFGIDQLRSDANFQYAAITQGTETATPIASDFHDQMRENINFGKTEFMLQIPTPQEDADAFAKWSKVRRNPIDTTSHRDPKRRRFMFINEGIEPERI